MAGEFDDLMPGYKKTIPGSVATTGGGAFDDLMPQPKSPEDERREKLRQMALAQMKQSSGEPGASDLFSNSYTLGLQKPVSGLAGALGGELSEALGYGEPATFGERYGANTGAYQDYMDEARKNSGWGGTAADIGGSIFSGGPARNVVQQAAASLPKLIGQNALLGGIEGAATNSEDLGSAAWGGAGGATVSGAATGILGGLLDYAKSRTPAAKAERAIQREISRGPDPNDIRQASRDIYRVLDQGGVAYDLNQSTQLADDIMNELVHGKGGWDPKGAHSMLGGVVERIAEMRGQPLSLATLQQIREQAGASAAANEPSVRNAAGRILSAIDGYVQNVNPAQSALPAGQDVGPLWKEARRLWKTANTVDDINWRMDKAERRAQSTNSGQNEENAIRQNIRGVVDKATQPRRFNPYSPDEIAQMNRVVEGTPAQNAARWTGNFLSGWPAQMAAAAPSAGVAALNMAQGGDLATALLTSGAGLAGQAGMYGAGHALKGQATRMAQDEADKLVRLISTGSMNVPALVSRQGPPTREGLALALAKQSLLRNAPDAAGALFGVGNSRTRGQ